MIEARVEGMDELKRGMHTTAVGLKQGIRQWLRAASMMAADTIKDFYSGKMGDRGLNARTGFTRDKVRRQIDYSASMAKAFPTTQNAKIFEFGGIIKPKGKAMVAEMKEVTRFPNRGIAKAEGVPGKDYFIMGGTGDYGEHKKSGGLYEKMSVLVMRKGLFVKAVKPVQQAWTRVKPKAHEMFDRFVGAATRTRR